MTIVGNMKNFAVEWIPDEELGVPYVSLILWISGRRIGSIEDPVSSIALEKRFQEFQVFSRHRGIPDSEKFSADEIFAEIYESCVITSMPGENMVDAIKRTIRKPISYEVAERYRNTFYFDEVIGASVLDRYNILLLREDGLRRERLIYRDLATMTIYESFFSIGTVEDVMVKTIAGMVK